MVQHVPLAERFLFITLKHPSGWNFLSKKSFLNIISCFSVRKIRYGLLKLGLKARFDKKVVGGGRIAG